MFWLAITDHCLRANHNHAPNLDKDILKIILLWAFQEDSLELLNIVGKGDILKEDFDTIYDLCIQCSRGIARNKWGIRSTKVSGRGVTKAEIGNLLDSLRTDILSTFVWTDWHIASKIETNRIRKNYGHIFPTCRKKHPQRECSLNSRGVCNLWAEAHDKFMPIFSRTKSGFSRDKRRYGAVALYGT